MQEPALEKRTKTKPQRPRRRMYHLPAYADEHGTHCLCGRLIPPQNLALPAISRANVTWVPCPDCETLRELDKQINWEE